jgi:hypothetical protein
LDDQGVEKNAWKQDGHREGWHGMLENELILVWGGGDIGKDVKKWWGCKKGCGGMLGALDKASSNLLLKKKVS